MAATSNLNPNLPMDSFFLAFLIALGAFALKAKEQSQRVALLGSHLSQFQIEKLMEQLTDGYLRALGEDNPERRAQVWALLASTEEKLCDQFSSFAAGFAKEAERPTRVSRWPLAFPRANLLFPQTTFDMRRALTLHAQSLRNASNNSLNQSVKGKAFTLLAEIFLMQHTCHWFCKSKTVASARLLARHKTSYEKVLASVAPQTRQAYLALIGS